MTPEQITAFQAGSTAQPAEVNAVMLGLLCAALFVWTAWVLLHAWQGFCGGSVTLRQFGGIVARATFLLLVCFWLILS
ncbi:TIGR03758 family integrating conjugative element protein [Lonsdalea quercina]|uniref:TIGR03758 family integrating conjugative element protein n=1 Tax=Lonsdalea quercina TaxID=71657 RepID=UPI003975349B